MKPLMTEDVGCFYFLFNFSCANNTCETLLFLWTFVVNSNIVSEVPIVLSSKAIM